MIEKTGKDIDGYECYEIACDFCSSGTLEVSAESWHDMIDNIKSEGWRTVKHDREWHQKCPDCVEGV